jgi:methionyl-tRNA synthetase
MKKTKTFSITTAIAYVNAAPHMGHALEFVLTDALARYHRLKGDSVHFLTGTDEHGVKIFNASKKAGMEPQAFVDMNAETFINLHKLLNSSNDDFIRTTDRKRHWPACQSLWKKLSDAGDLYEKEYEGLYCEGCEAFLLPRDLVNGNCSIHLKPPTIVKEKNWFFRLSKYSDRILKLIESDTLKIVPDARKNEILGVVREGLTDVSFSRPREVLPWGVEVPGDPSQVMYVWCDALTNYISALGYADNGPNFKTFWPADLHVIGKDIVRFHAGIWIGMLLSAGIPIPKGILIHGFVTHDGHKMSKSLGNVVDPVGLVHKYGTDALRFFLLREIPNGRDGDYSEKLFIERYNSDLAKNLGNLANRVHTLITKNGLTDFVFEQGSELFRKQTEETWAAYSDSMDAHNIHEAIGHVWKLIDFCNKQVDVEKPWALVKTDMAKAKVVLCNVLETLRHATAMIAPFIPASSVSIRAMIGLPPVIVFKDESEWGSVERWHSLGNGTILFPRIQSTESSPI